MKASAGVAVEPGVDGRGRPQLVEVRSDPPLTLRWADGCLYVVGSAFAPLGGDELELTIDVAAWASLTVRTVAASVAQPGRSDAPSRFRVTARVAAGATLRWLPEPGVAVDGCRHLNETHLDLDEGAEVEWREEVVLGRHGKPGGQWRSVMTATRDGVPLLVQDTVVGGPDWASPATGGGARAAGSMLLVGPDAPAEAAVHTRAPTGRAAVMPLARPGAAVVNALAPDARTLRCLLDAGCVQTTG